VKSNKRKEYENVAKIKLRTSRKKTSSSFKQKSGTIDVIDENSLITFSSTTVGQGGAVLNCRMQRYTLKLPQRLQST
jgi:hypothetical protein